MADPNIEMLIQVAEALGDLRERLVLVGGCATALLITDPAAAPVRATKDVDAIIAVVSKPAYHDLGEALRAKGFSQPLEEGDPPYRWTFAGLKLDVMPIDPCSVSAIVGTNWQCKPLSRRRFGKDCRSVL